MVQLKVGRNIIDIDKNDLILDNGACQQIITKEVGFGCNKSTPVLSKKLFADLKICGLIYTSEELRQQATERYTLNPDVRFYKFDIEQMKKMGY
jgi:hypothetical protein